MRLRPSVTAERAIQVIEERILAAQGPLNERSSADVKRNLYLNWVYETEVQLQAIFADAVLEDPILSRGYWHICASSRTNEQLMDRLVGEELRFQAGFPGIPNDSGGRLGETVAALRSMTGLAARRGRISVPDTNALLHYTRFDRLPWSERIGHEVVRLVIPLVVVDELDAKKYARREEFQQRARELLSLIDGYVTNSSPDGYSQIGQGVTVEILPDEPGHLRMASNDQEILDRTQFLGQATGHPVTLITGDSGMRINAQSRGIEVFKLSDSDLLPRYRQQEPGSGPP